MKLETVIGLEIHVQLNTHSKLFSSSNNDAFGAEPNSRINEVDMGMPGVLPVLNESALKKGVLASAALGCEIQKFSKFDRKNYFYPDLPFGYQISQYDKPIALAGKVKIPAENNGGFDEIRITRVHLENDAGKLTHAISGTFCDYNRAGTPLIEIVTEPDIRSAEEAQTLAKEIQKIVRCVDASDADMEKGMMRFDASISLRPQGEQKLYPRTEIKNLNSFSSLLKAIKCEQQKQKVLWEAGNAPTADRTVGWLDDKGDTMLLREKESATDYRYFPEPDLPPIEFTDEEIAEFLAQVPELPLEKYHRYVEKIGLAPADALKISEAPTLYNFFEAACETSDNPKKIATLFLSVVLAHNDWDQGALTPTHLSDVYALQKSGKISSSAAKTIIEIAMKNGKTAETLMQELNLEQKSDSGELEKIIDEIIGEQAAVVEEIKDGKVQKLQFLVGQVMQKTKGQANPQMAQEILRKKLGIG